MNAALKVFYGYDMKGINRKAFTLTEILIVLVVLSVTAGLAIPSYFSTIEQSRSNEALVNLNIIHMGEKIYRLNNGTFVAGGSLSALNTALNTDMSAVYYTTVSVTITGTTAYTATLTRNTVSGGAGTKWFRYTYADGDAAPTLTQGGAY